MLKPRLRRLTTEEAEGQGVDSTNSETEAERRMKPRNPVPGCGLAGIGSRAQYLTGIAGQERGLGTLEGGLHSEAHLRWDCCCVTGCRRVRGAVALRAPLR